MHSSSLLPASLVALALLPFELPDVAIEDDEFAGPGAMVTIEPSGMVVVPLKPLGPDVTLLDMVPFVAIDWSRLRASLWALLCALLCASLRAVAERDDVLAAAALEDEPVAQALLAWRSPESP